MDFLSRLSPRLGKKKLLKIGWRSDFINAFVKYHENCMLVTKLGYVPCRNLVPGKL